MAGQTGSIRGIVHDPDHLPIAGATVVLTTPESSNVRRTETSKDGEFLFDAVPPGNYVLHVTHPGLFPLMQMVTVGAETPRMVHVQLKLPPQQESVEVSEADSTVRTESVTPTTTVTRSEIARTPGADRTNSLAMITDYVPGAYLAHDQLHVRGGHQVSWLVDGVPVPNTNIASNVGPQIDPKDIDTLEVERGSYSAAEGDRTYGVFNAIPQSGFERNRQAQLVANYGNFHQTNDQLSFGDHTERFAWYASASGDCSDLGLENPGPAVIHDQGNGFSGFGTVFYNVTSHDQLRVVGSSRRDAYQIPNTPGAQQAGTRDREVEDDSFITASWVHTAGAGRIFTVSPFYHYNLADYLGGPNDPELTTRDRQASDYAGMQATANMVTKRHDARFGVYGFDQTSHQLFDVTPTSMPGIPISQRSQTSGYLAAVFAEDQFKLTQWLTLTGGVRLTHFAGSLSENSADPRLGAALRLPRLHWVLRGFYGRYYQAPPLATVSGPLLDFALGQGLGFLPLHGERDEELQFGVSIPLRRWTIDLDHFHQHGANLFDHGALGNSNIFLPLTIGAGRVVAWEATVRSPLVLGHVRMHLAYSRQRAEGFGAVTGGLTDFSPPQGGFLLDHDQEHTLNTGGSASLPRRSWIAGNYYFGSGFPDNGGPARLAAHSTFDISAGKDFGENLSVSVNAINVANRRFLLDNSLTFGGTHYFDPREIYGQITYRFRF